MSVSTDLTRPRYANPEYWNDMWEPGDPLYSHPAYQYGNPDSQVVRYLIDIFLDGDVWSVPWFREWAEINDRHACEACLVSWAMTEGPVCWNCGKDIRKPLDEEEVA